MSSFRITLFTSGTTINDFGEGNRKKTTKKQQLETLLDKYFEGKLVGAAIRKRCKSSIIWGSGADFCKQFFFFGDPPNQDFIFCQFYFSVTL